MILLNLSMLLQRLYNWIKYKSLPSSFLFKNRLFIERNTKHRRIYSIFGALIRNSKWGNFELSNLKIQFRLNYTKYIFWIFLGFILFFLSWFFKKYYIYTYAFNSVALFVWLSIDAFDYYLSFGLWCITAFIAISTNWVYSYFIERVNFKPVSFKTIFSSSFFDDFVRTEDVIQQPALDLLDVKYLFYNWISHNNNSHDNSIFLENFFDSEINKKQWENCYDFFIKLFKATHLCNLNSEFFSIKYLHYTFTNLKPLCFNSNLKQLFLHYSNTTVINNHFTLLFWYTLNGYLNYYSWRTSNLPSLRLLQIQHIWNLNTFDIESNKYSLSNVNMAGGFYLPFFTFNNLSSYSFNFFELWNFSSFAKNQINAAKWNRWLYKYSILHRRFLRNSHKITLTKKLFTSGFYDNKFFNKNTWNAAHTKGINVPFLNNLNSIYYKNLLNTASPSTLKWQTQNLNPVQSHFMKKNIALFSFYENSYLWVAKRFFCFNTIPSNFINSSINTKTLNNINAMQKNKFESQIIWYSIFNSYLNKLYSFNVNIFNITKNNKISAVNQCFIKNLNFTNNNNYYNKDIYLIFDDNDLLSNELLDIAYWVTTANSNVQGTLYAINYLNFNFYTPLTNPKILNKFFITNIFKFKNIIPYDKSILIENKYLFDFILLSYYY